MKSKEDRQKLLAEIESLRSPLPLNPDRVGVAALFELSSILFSYRERVSSILREAIDDMNEATKSQIMAKEKHRVKANEILSREEIKILKPISVQQAACEVFLGPDNKAVMDSELTLADTRIFAQKVQMILEDIKDKLRTIKVQADISAQLNGYSPLPAGTDLNGRVKGIELH